MNRRIVKIDAVVTLDTFGDTKHQPSALDCLGEFEIIKWEETEMIVIEKK